MNVDLFSHFIEHSSLQIVVLFYYLRIIREAYHLIKKIKQIYHYSWLIIRDLTSKNNVYSYSIIFYLLVSHSFYLPPSNFHQMFVIYRCKILGPCIPNKFFWINFWKKYFRLERVNFGHLVLSLWTLHNLPKPTE